MYASLFRDTRSHRHTARSLSAHLLLRSFIMAMWTVLDVKEVMSSDNTIRVHPRAIASAVGKDQSHRSNNYWEINDNHVFRSSPDSMLGVGTIGMSRIQMDSCQVKPGDQIRLHTMNKDYIYRIASLEVQLTRHPIWKEGDDRPIDGDAFQDAFWLQFDGDVLVLDQQVVVQSYPYYVCRVKALSTIRRRDRTVMINAVNGVVTTDSRVCFKMIG
jgi:hypothetical protein